MLKLNRAYLNSGVMINGVVVEVEEGCPQGGPLSPPLSNVVLDELNRELERRGHKFCRYADDCNAYVKNKRAGVGIRVHAKPLDKFKDRVMENLSRSNGRSME